MTSIRSLLEQTIRANGVRASARAMGKSPAVVSLFLKGERDLTLSDIEQLQHAFALTIYAPPPRGDPPVRRPRRDPPDARAATPPRD